MGELIRKLSSRKLWAMIAGVTTGIAIAFGADASDIQVITGAVTSLVSLVTYILTEGKIDATNVGKTVEKIKDVADIITDESKN